MVLTDKRSLWTSGPCRQVVLVDLKRKEDLPCPHWARTQVPSTLEKQKNDLNDHRVPFGVFQRAYLYLLLITGPKYFPFNVTTRFAALPKIILRCSSLTNRSEGLRRNWLIFVLRRNRSEHMRPCFCTQRTHIFSFFAPWTLLWCAFAITSILLSTLCLSIFTSLSLTPCIKWIIYLGSAFSWMI